MTSEMQCLDLEKWQNPRSVESSGHLEAKTQSSSSEELTSLSQPLFLPTDSSPTIFFPKESSSPPGLPRTPRIYRGEKIALAVIVLDKDINYMGLDDFPSTL